MHDHGRTGAGRNSVSARFRIDQERARVDVHENRACTGQGDGLGGRGERKGRDQDLVAGPNIKCTQGQAQRVRAGSATDHVTDAEHLAEFCFQSLDLRTQHVPATAQHAQGGGLDILLQGRVLRGQVQDGDGGAHEASVSRIRWVTSSAVRKARRPSSPPHHGFGALPDAVDEMVDLFAQRIGFLESLGRMLDAFRGRGIAFAQAVAVQFPLVQVEGVAGMVLEDAHPAFAAAAQAAGGDIGDAAAGELEPGVGDVQSVADHGGAASADFVGILADHGQGEVDVMDHQVQSHVDFGAARGPGRQAVDLDETGGLKPLHQGAERRVEPPPAGRPERCAASGGRVRSVQWLLRPRR